LALRSSKPVPGCQSKRHEQYDIGIDSKETDILKNAYKKIGFLEAQSRFVSICDYFQDWSIKKDQLSAKEKAIEDLIIPFDELLEGYIQNLRSLEKKPSSLRIKKESDMTLGGGNP
jgi:hypothetical protein